MSRRILIIVLFVFVQFLTNGQKREHLLPLLSNIDTPDPLIRYDQAVRDYLVKDGKRLHGSMVRVVVQSSCILPFSWRIDRDLDKDSTYFLTYTQSTVDIWKKVYNKVDISDSDIKKNRAEIQKEDAQLIETLFYLALMTTRYPEAKEIKNYEFGYGEANTFLFSVFHGNTSITSYSESVVDSKPCNDRISCLENICLKIKQSLEKFNFQEKYILPIEEKERIKVLIGRFKDIPEN